MKNEMKRYLAVAAALLFISMTNCPAIEGLQISVVNSNAVLTWPSENNGDTFLVQHRSNLVSGDWITLADYLPVSPSNTTTFIDTSNLVQVPVVSGGGNGEGNIMPQAMAKPANGSGAAAPLAIYPPGFDFSDYVISNPATGQWESGSRYAASHPTTVSRVQSGGGVQPMDATGDDTNQYTGFYRVVRDGVHLWGITNGMVVSNVLITTLEFAVDSTDQVVGVTFYDTNSDSPLIGASGQSLGSNKWLLVWNTTESFNGDYAIEAELNFASDPTVVSQPVTVTVNNIISFPNYFSQVYGDQMWIYAVTIPDAAFELDMYDENTNYLGSFSGNADDSGTISFLWNLVDDNGNLSDSTNISGTFTVYTSDDSNVRAQAATQTARPMNFLATTPTMKAISPKYKANGESPQPLDYNAIASSKQLWVKEGKWTPNDNWVVAYAPLTDDSTTLLKEQSTMVGDLSDENLGVLNALVNDTDSNLSPGNVPNSTAFELKDATTRSQLLSYLADHRYENFYYLGHGDDSHISAYNGAASAISKDQIANALGNVPLSYEGPGEVLNADPPLIVYPSVSPSIRRVALHPYRFVFLDGCETAAGNFSEAFGIPAVTVNTNFFATMKVESRAFVGYTKTVKFNTAQWQWRADMVIGFLQDWRTRHLTVQDCVNNAEAGAHSSGFQPMDSSATIYGAADMNVNTRTRP